MLAVEHLGKLNKEEGMSGVRVLVGTRKGAFILTADGKRERLGRQRPPLWRLGDLSPEGFVPSIRIGCMRRSRAAGSAR